MQVTKGLSIGLLLLLSGCAVGGSGVKEDFVEIPNPAITMSPNAPATIWVPRSYVESGPPRGGELVKQGYEKVTSGPGAAAAQQQKRAGSELPPRAPFQVGSRVALIEAGDNHILAPFGEEMKRAKAGVILDQGLSAPLSATADLATQTGRSTLAVRLQQKYDATVAVFLSAPEGVAPGKPLQAAVYDGMGGMEVKTVSAELPAFAPADQAARQEAVRQTLSALSKEVKEIVALLPWYAKVVAVDGKRIYLDAGSEAGIWIGQTLVLHRPGKVIPGLGYAPGEKIGTLEVTGLVGTNGAYGELKSGKEIKAEDLVTLE